MRVLTFAVLAAALAACEDDSGSGADSALAGGGAGTSGASNQAGATASGVGGATAGSAGSAAVGVGGQTSSAGSAGDGPSNVGGFGGTSGAGGEAMTGNAGAEPARFLALGDSYTIGESVSEEERWPVQLAEMLRTQGVALDDPQIIARTGWTTDELDAGIDAAAPEGPFDMVSLLIGVNNQFRGRSVDEYQVEFVALLARAIEYAAGQPDHVLVLSIPDYGVTPFGAAYDPATIAQEIDAFNAVNRAEADAAGTRYVDVTPISREAETNPDLIALDDLHPSGAMYAEWASLAYSDAYEVLSGL